MTRWLTVRVLRRRWLGFVVVALVITLGAGGALVAAGAAQRTAHAYGDYLRRADVGDVVVNPSLATSDMDRTLRSLPGVRRVTSDTLLLAGITDRARLPATLREAVQDEQSTFTAVRGSVNGRYSTMDRPIIRRGRLPTGNHEVFLNEELARKRKVGVGDAVTVGFIDAADAMFGGLDDPVHIDTEQATVVGVGVFADGVLPDHLYPREVALVSPDIARRHDCLPPAPAPGADPEQALRDLLPDGCAAAYHYYSFAVDGGDAGVSKVLSAAARRFTAANAGLPFAAADDAPSYFMIPTTTAEERDRVQRAIQPTVVALEVLAAAAGLATLVIAGFAAAREIRLQQGDQRQWADLGVARRARTIALAAPLVIAVLVGTAAAVAIAWALSTVGPAGVARAADPAPARELRPLVALLAGGFAVVACLGALALAWASTRRARGATAPLARTSLLGRVLRWQSRPEVDEGMRAAFGRGRGAALVVGTGAAGVAVLLTAFVFGTSLARLVATPSSYGWPWQAAWLAGSGYGGVDVDELAASLASQPAVVGWDALALSVDVQIDGRTTVTVTDFGRGSRPMTVAAGRLPSAAGEIALGARTARSLGVGIGDHVELEAAGIVTPRARVTGIVVLPPLGPFQSDRAGPGTGAYLDGSSFEPGTMSVNTAFAGLRLADGADPVATLDRLRPAFLGWQGSDYTVEYTRAVRPPEIDDAERMQLVPGVVGGLLAAGAVAALGITVALSVRSRRRVLGMLRTLGFTRRQVRVSVLTHSAAISVGALAVGLPLGLAAGRTAWRLFAEQIGVDQTAHVPIGWVFGVAAGTVALAVAAGAIPARAAARARPADVLRAE